MTFPCALLLLGAKILGLRKRLLSLTLQLSSTLCFIALVDTAMAQGAPSGDTQVNGVVLTKLSPPVYPPLSRQARITGDVKLQVWIWRNGSVASADVVSGHPMLKLAALASAQKSTFECHGCTQELTPYSLTYTFGLRNDDNCSVTRLHSVKCLYLWRCGGWRSAEIRSPAVTQSQSHITILADAACVETISSNSSGG
jgi:TonB family protein